MNRIYLIGYMYSGKSTIGRLLAQRMGLAFRDLDVAIEEKYHTTIPLIFQRYGEEAFRKIERDALHQSASEDNVVISTGGGTPCHFDNMDFILQNGTAVYLEMNYEAILERMARSRKQRPLFAGKSQEERQQIVQEHLLQRLPYYSRAHVKVDSFNPDMEQMLDFIQKSIQKLKENPSKSN